MECRFGEAVKYAFKWKVIYKVFITLKTCFHQLLIKIYFNQIIILNLVLGSSTEAILTIFGRLHILLNPVSVVRDSHKLGVGFLRPIVTV